MGRRLRNVGVYFGLLDEDPDGPPPPLEPATLRSMLRSFAGIAAVLGVVVAVRRTPEEGLVWAAFTLVSAVLAAVARPWAQHRRTEISAIVDFLRITPLYIVSFAAVWLAWEADQPSSDAIEKGLVFGTMTAAISAFIDWRERRTTAP